MDETVNFHACSPEDIRHLRRRKWPDDSDAEACYTIAVGNKRVSALRVWPRTFSYDNVFDFDAWCVGQVYTAKPHRGNGYATKLVRKTIHRLQLHVGDRPLMAVVAEPPAALYARMGFFLIREVNVRKQRRGIYVFLMQKGIGLPQDGDGWFVDELW